MPYSMCHARGMLRGVLPLVLVLPGWARAVAPLSEADLTTLLRVQLDDSVIVGRLQQAGVSFTPDEAAIARCRQAGASEVVLAAMRTLGARKPPAVVKPLCDADVATLLTLGIDEAVLLRRLRQAPQAAPLDPSRAEALTKAGASAALLNYLRGSTPASARTGPVMDLILILDCSVTMKRRLKDDSTVMVTAKRTVNELILAIPNGRRLALFVYGGGAGCQAVKLVRPFMELTDDSKKLFMASVINVEAAGAAPLAYAVRTAAQQLDGAGGDAGLILVGNCADSCQGDPLMAISTLAHRSRFTFGLQVVAFELEDDERKTVDALAAAGRGKCYDGHSVGLLKSLLEGLKEQPGTTVALKPVPEVEPERPKPMTPAPVPVPVPVVEEVPAAVRALLDALDDPDVKVRTAATTSLGSQKHPSVLVGLGRALNDKDGYVRRAAADSLAKLGGSEVIPLLVQRIADELWFPAPDGSFSYFDEPYDGFRGLGSKDHALAALKKVAPDKVPDALRAAGKAKDARVRAWASKELE